MIGSEATVALSTFAFAVVSTYAVRTIALKRGYVSQPRADRWSQRRVALMGGIALTMAFFAGYALVLSLHEPPQESVWPFRPEIVTLLIGAVAMCALGFIDDLSHLKPSTKIIGQIACAAPLIGLGPRLHWTGFEVLDVLVSFFWVIGITNAFNLLDNMDGLSAGTGCIASIFCAVLFTLYGQPELALIALVLAAATAGFLVFNFNPASIFMGDSGSLFIGYMLAGLTLFSTGTREPDLVAVIAVPAVLLAIPIFDTSLVTVLRKLSGRAISQGGRDHSSHRLVALGLSERRTVLLLWSLSAAAGAVAVLTNLRELPMGRLLLPLFVLFLIILGVYLARVKVYEATQIREGGLAGKITPLLTDLMYKRRASAVLLDIVQVTVAYYAAYLLRFEQSPFDVNLAPFTESLPFIIPCKMIALFVFGAYRGVWRYTGLNELISYAKASLAGSALSVLAVAVLFRFDGYSRSVFVIDALIMFLMLAGSRLSFRLFDTVIRRQAPGGRVAVIYGAGDGGQFALRELLNNEALHFAPVGFIDDDPNKQRLNIDGYPILGDLSRFESIVEQYGVGAVVLSSDKIAPDRLAQLGKVCSERGVEVFQLKMSFKEIDLTPRPQAVGLGD